MMEHDLPAWAAIPASVLLIVGGILALTGSIGLLRLKTFYKRIHSPTLGNTFGSFCVLAASIITSSAIVGRPVLHEVMITVFLILTSPVTAMMLMRAAVFRNRGTN
ncbi:MAG: monovalent cation/H(+) antiporter subunit G [Achromobacter sp.]|jgi:multicomponent K+:H+ antiporter subunit G